MTERLDGLARAMAGLALALGMILVLAMVTVAPVSLEGGIARVIVPAAGDSVKIPGQAFSCQLSQRQDRCEAVLRKQELAIAVNYPDAQRQPFATNVTCQGTYGGRPVPCSVAYDFGTGSLPIVHLEDDLDWGSADHRALRQRYPAAQLGEPGWLRLTLGWVVLMAGAIALGLGTALDGSRGALVVAIAGLSGFVLALAVLVWGSLALLSRSSVAPRLETGLDPWGSLPLIGLLAAILFGATAFGWGVAGLTQPIVSLLPRWLNRFLASFSGGLAIALITFLGSRWRPSMPQEAALGMAGVTGAIAAAAICWRPGSLGRLCIGLYGGVLALGALAYLNLWLLLGLGLVD